MSIPTPIVCWPLNGDLNDVIGSYHLGTGAGTANWHCSVNDMDRQSLRGDGSFYANMADDDKLDFGDTNWTVACVVTILDIESNHGLVQKDYDETDRQWRLGFDYSSGDFTFIVFNSSNGVVAKVTTGSPNTQGTYLLVAGNDADNSRAFLSVNGAAEETVSHSGTPGQGTAEISVLRGIGLTPHTDGIIQDVAFWDSKLTASQITELWNNGKPLRYPYDGDDKRRTVRTIARAIPSSWHTKPKVIELDNNLYVTGATSTMDQGNVPMCQFNLEDQTLTSFESGIATYDEHTQCAMNITKQYPPVYMRTGHNGTNYAWFAKGTTPGDISTFGAESIVGIGGLSAYSQLWRAYTNPDHLVGLCRKSSYYWAWIESTDGGDNWSFIGDLVQWGGDNKAYMNTQVDRDILYAVWFQHPYDTNSREIRFFYVDLTTNTVYLMDGTSLGTVAAGPYNSTDIPAIYTGDSGTRCRVFEMIANPKPHILMANWTTGDTDNGWYYVLRYDGSVWEYHKIVQTGEEIGYTDEVNYVSGGSFANENTLYIARSVDSVWRLEKYTTKDHWQTHTQEILTTSSTHKITRPIVPVGNHEVEVAFQLTSSYPSGAYYPHWADWYVIPKTRQIVYTAWNNTTNSGEPGDELNHTLRLISDGYENTPTNYPGEIDATNAPGQYILELTPDEYESTNYLTLVGKSSTATVSIAPVTIHPQKITSLEAQACRDLLQNGRIDDVLDNTIADTNELQADWTDGGRLDTILDARAATGSDSDTLETISDQLDLITNQGSGARTVTVTVNDGSNLLESASIRFTKGAATYVQQTNSSGQATFNLDDGTYTVAISLIGYTYSGTTLVVDGDETETYSMTALTITEPSDVTLCTVQFRVKLSNTAVSGAVCKAKLQGVNQAADGTILSNVETSDTTDSEGIAELELVRKGSIVKGSGVYKIWIEISGNPVSSVETAIPNQSVILFEDLLI